MIPRSSYLRERLEWKSHSLTKKEVRGIEEESATPVVTPKSKKEEGAIRAKSDEYFNQNSLELLKYP